MDLHSRLNLNRVAVACHFLAFLCCLIGIEVLLFGGFRFFIGDLKVSATQLRNPLLLILGLTLFGKVLNPSLSLRDVLLIRTVRRVRAAMNKLKPYLEHTAAFWIGLIFLNILLFLPAFMLQIRESSLIPIPPLDGPRGWYDTLLFFFRRDNQDFFRLCADFYLMVTVMAITANSGLKVIVPRFCMILFFSLLFYQIYESLSVKIFGQKPLFYSDALLIKHAAYLVVDIWTPKLFHTVVRIIAWALITMFLIRYSFASITYTFRHLRMTTTIVLSGTLVWVFILFITFWFGLKNDRPITQWIIPKIIENLHESVRGYTTLQNIHKEPLEHYTYGDIRLTKRPNVYLFMVESYGKILVTHPDFRNPYHQLMAEIERSLEKSGWFGATNYSAAPISGGKSWLSAATILSGLRVENQAVYMLLLRWIPDYSHLVRFFQVQGYHTFALHPPMRKRPGFSFELYENFYGYNTWIYYDDLNYTGKEYGWGLIPDQFSLNYTHEKFIEGINQPFFLFFTTVTAHAPWYDLPPYPSDWQGLNDPESYQDEFDQDKSPGGVWHHMEKTYARHFKKNVRLKDAFKGEDYLSHMFYQMRLIRDYIIQKAPENSIIVIIGDHQPPIFTTETDGFQTPIHIISKDLSFVDSFRAYEFIPGLTKDPDLEGDIRHEGIYSMLVRLLTALYDPDQAYSLPHYRPDGIPLSILRE